MLEYLPEPSRGIAEMRRVLKPGGTLLLSVAAFYPRAVDEEHWRFLRAGVRHLLKNFQSAEIVPEGSSLTGFVRSCEVVFGIFARVTFVRTLLSWTLFPVMNVAGLVLESLAGSSNDQAAGNYSVCARK
jgi:SAM-dependent methyltransferase